MDRKSGRPCRVTAVVVTYNRKKLLEECLLALLNQTADCDLKILVVDNASTDGTLSFIEPILEREERIRCMTLAENLGGAGGFCEGMKRAVEDGCDYVWIMDDDTIPEPAALKELLETAKQLENRGGADGKAAFGFLSSKVLWTDGTLCLMNRQHFLKHAKEDAEEPDCGGGADGKNGGGIRPVDQATFVSLLFPEKVISGMGLPLREYFIWGDDKEYTLRLSDAYPCYYVPKSAVVHKMGQNTGSNITFDGMDRIPRYFYAYRNDLATAKRRGIGDVLIYFAAFGLNMVRILAMSPDYRGKRLVAMWKGMLAGVRFSPRVEFAEKRRKT